MSAHYFLDVIKSLREKEEVLLYHNILDIPENESQLVVDFLENEYLKEKVNFPVGFPPYSKEAALWGAKFIYLASQLILFRETEIEDLDKVLPHANFKTDDGVFK